MRNSISAMPNSCAFTAVVCVRPQNQKRGASTPFITPAVTMGRIVEDLSRIVFRRMGMNPKDSTAKISIISSDRKIMESGEKYPVSSLANAAVVEPAMIMDVSATQPSVEACARLRACGSVCPTSPEAVCIFSIIIQ